MSAPLEQRTYVVEPDTPRQLAGALMRYRAVRSISPWLGVAALVGLASAAAAGQWVPALVFAVVALSTAFTTLTQYRGTANLLAAGAYRPGTPLTVDWFADRFVVAAPQGSAAHALSDVRAVSPGGAVVLVAMRTKREIVVLPAALVGDRGRELLAAAVAR